MPYVARSVPQALDIIDPGVQDVYSSPSVFINNVAAALWQPPILGNSALAALNMPADPVVPDYAPTQAQRDNYAASEAAGQSNPEPVEIVAGQGAGQSGSIAQGNMPGTNTTDPNDLVGNPPTADSPVVVPAGESVQARIESFLNQCIQESAGGAWKETGNNPNIMNCFNQLGFPPNKLPAPGGDKVAWCAAFAGTVLKASGSPYIQNNLSAKAFSSAWKGAQSIPITDPTQWRRNDLIVMSFGSGNHVAFIRGVDLKNNKYQMAGGNQSDNMTQVNVTGINKIYYVGRAWQISPEFDQPIITNLSGGGVVPKTR